MSLPHSHLYLRAREWQPLGPAADRVSLSYAERLLRRKRLVTVTGMAFLVDLAETVSLNQGDAFSLADGRLIEVTADVEEVVSVRGDLPRLAWHIGNRHTPCQIEDDRLVIARDHVLEAMLRQLGADISYSSEPFTPEGGAYGHGRTMGHEHGTASIATPGQTPAAFGLHHHGDGQWHSHGPTGHSAGHNFGHSHSPVTQHAPSGPAGEDPAPAAPHE
jgi:urease accessory protein